MKSPNNLEGDALPMPQNDVLNEGQVGEDLVSLYGGLCHPIAPEIKLLRT